MIVSEGIFEKKDLNEYFKHGIGTTWSFYTVCTSYLHTVTMKVIRIGKMNSLPGSYVHKRLDIYI